MYRTSKYARACTLILVEVCGGNGAFKFPLEIFACNVNRNGLPKRNYETNGKRSGSEYALLSVEENLPKQCGEQRDDALIRKK